MIIQPLTGEELPILHEARERQRLNSGHAQLPRRQDTGLMEKHISSRIVPLSCLFCFFLPQDLCYMPMLEIMRRPCVTLEFRPEARVWQL